MATSKLQRHVSEKLSVFFGGFTIRENTRPEWLVTEFGERLELDFYIEELDVAIEVQGIQHYQFTPFFQESYEEFRKRLRLDAFKVETCETLGIQLFEVFDELSAQEAVERIHLKAYQQPMKEQPVSVAKQQDAKSRAAKAALIHIHEGLTRKTKYQAKLNFYQRALAFVDVHGLNALELDGKDKAAEIVQKMQMVAEEIKSHRAMARSKQKEKHPETQGRQRRRQRARRLYTITRLDEFHFIVLGGTQWHMLELKDKSVSCDCESFSKGIVCSHVYLYEMTFQDSKEVALINNRLALPTPKVLSLAIVPYVEFKRAA